MLTIDASERSDSHRAGRRHQFTNASAILRQYEPFYAGLYRPLSGAAISKCSPIASIGRRVIEPDGHPQRQGQAGRLRRGGMCLGLLVPSRRGLRQDYTAIRAKWSLTTATVQ